MLCKGCLLSPLRRLSRLTRPCGDGERKTAARPRRGGALARILGCSKGATIIEFAFVCPILIALLLAAFETLLVLFAQQVLLTAATQSARLIMTNQAGNMTQAQFQQVACDNLPSMFNCANLFVNVQTFSSFASVSAPNPVQNGKLQSGQLTFSPGQPGSIESVQLYYLWPVISAPLGFSLANLGNGTRLLVATVAFKNEP
jgi:Flp pilus assembly protein TadG